MALTKIGTDGVKDDAITSGKIPANAVGSSEIADNSVDTNAIQDQAVALSKLPHGTSSNDGKFLRANNGADPTFETVNTDLVADTSPQLGGALDTNGSNINFGDSTSNGVNVNRLTFGTATNGDLALWHDGSNSYIVDQGTGELRIRGAEVVKIQDSDSAEDMAVFNKNGSAELYHNNVKKFETHDVGTIFTQPNFSGGGNGAIKVNTTLDNYGSIIVRNQTHNSHNTAALQVENNSSGTNETNLILRSVSLNSGSWAHAWYGAKSHRFGIQTGTDGTSKVQIDTNGIKFNGDQAAANALNDYEEGTYTPTDQSGAGLSLTNNTTARYTKIGRMVYVQFDITWPSTSDSTDASFSLPFSLQVSYGGGVVNWTDRGYPLFVHIGSRAYIMDNSSSSGNSSQHAKNNEMSGKRAIGNFWYIG